MKIALCIYKKEHQMMSKIGQKFNNYFFWNSIHGRIKSVQSGVAVVVERSRALRHGRRAPWFESRYQQQSILPKRKLSIALIMSKALEIGSFRSNLDRCQQQFKGNAGMPGQCKQQKRLYWQPWITFSRGKNKAKNKCQPLYCQNIILG